MNTKNRLHHWLHCSNRHGLDQLIIFQAIVAMLIIALSFALGQLREWLLAVGVWLDLLLAIGIMRLPQHFTRFKQANGYLQSFVFPLGLSLAWYSLGKLIFKLGPLGETNILIACWMPVYFVMFVPVAIKYARTIANSWLRGILLIVWLLEIVLTNFTRGVAVSPFFKAVVSSGFLGSVALVITIMIAMRQWHLRGPQLKHCWTQNTRWLTMLVVLMLLPILLMLGNSNWSLAIYRNSNWVLFLTSVEAGIAEEFTFRYGLFSMIYQGMRKCKGNVGLAIFLTSLIFGCMHLFNLGQQPLSTTLCQVTVATFIGVVFQIVYLYTGQLWITVVTHFFYDWTGFIAAQTTTETWSTPVGMVYTQLMILTVLIIALLLWVHFGKRHLVMVEHANYLTESVLKE